MSRPARKALFFLLLISGCVSPHQEALQVAKPPEASRGPIAPKLAETPVDQGAPMATPASPTFSREEIRLLQARLKAAGFYAAPVDGIAGPKTRSGVLRLQAACANLKDLLETSNSEIFQASGRSQAAKPDSKGVRLTQVRLKDAGFDPGPIDGLRGPKTTAALLRFQAGCTMLKNVPPTWDQELRASDKPSPRSREEKSQPATAKSAVTEFGNSAGAKQIPDNEKIRQEQLRLREAGFDPGPIDGILGPKTKAAMQRYQKSLRLKKITART
jgi:peptidoglycan hydrolase-like protein with peptidoglycan-binding domain